MRENTKQEDGTTAVSAPQGSRRKRSQRATKTGVKRPHQAVTWERINADPVRRAALLEAQARGRDEARKANPGKRWSRSGIPDGYTRATAEEASEAARREATKVVEAMKKIGILAGTPEGELAAEALLAVVHIMRKPGGMNMRLKAARLVLEFTRPKPARRGGEVLTGAEDWLKQVVAMAALVEARP